MRQWLVATVDHFQYGWFTPTIGFIMSTLGCLLGLLFAVRARRTTGRPRAWLLACAAVAFGAPGIWLTHFIGLLGLDLPDSDVRYDPGPTALSLGVAVLAVWLGLAIACRARRSVVRVLLGGAVTGLGIAAMHFTGLAALRVGGTVRFNQPRAAATVLVAVAAAILMLSLVLTVRRRRGALLAAGTVAVAASAVHYTGMSTLEVYLHANHNGITGVNPIFLLMPIIVLGGGIIALLSILTFGQSPVDAVVAGEEAPPEEPLPVSPAVPPRYPPTFTEEITPVRATLVSGRLRVRGRN
jgi:NO-binding membrane sensor protein with MHYT domain